MKTLFDEILGIMQEYNIDTIYEINNIYYTRDEVEQIQMKQLKEFLLNICNYKSIALYGGGKFCDAVLDTLKKVYKINCIIDNNISKKYVKKDIPVVDIEYFIDNYKYIEAIAITSWDYHEAFKAELELINYQGDIIDIPEWLMKQFPDFKRPIYEYVKINYFQINELEWLYFQLSETEKYKILKKIIYALCMIKDFLYAEKYINEIEQYYAEFGESENYRNAINKIKKRLELCAKKEGKNTLFIHVVDSLADYVVDNMEWLNNQSKRGIRFKNLTVQYPCTHYSINTMFTGKSAFEIEKTTDMVEWKDSDLLRFIEKNYFVNIISGNLHVLRELQKINSNNSQNCCTLTEILFEGLAIWENKNSQNIIFMHSCGEIHTPYFSVGSKLRLVTCENMKNKLQFEQQFQNAVYYTDKELEWYDYFYNITKMPMIIMGDHGGTPKESYNYFFGVKKDITRGMKEILTPAFIINRFEKERKEIYALISNTKIPHILKAILEKKIEILDQVNETFIELEFPPGYEENYCKRFMSRGIYGQYEGFVGIKTLNEIYLISASGRELYFRPDEWQYQNLIKDDLYHESVEKCRNIVGNYKFPIDIFKLKKYKKHLELLEYYDNKCYQKIIKKIDTLEEER